MPIRSKIPENFLIPNTTIHEYMYGEIRKHGQTKAIIDKLTGQQWSYQELIAQSKIFAANIQEKGLRKGDVVVLILPNTVAFLIASFGTWEAGGVVSGLNPTYAPDEIRHALNVSKPKFVITLGDLYPSIKSALRSQRSIKEIICVQTVPPDTVPFTNLIKPNPRATKVFKAPPIVPREDVGLLPFSSGTTGLSKGVMLTHFNMIAMATILTRPIDLYFQNQVGENLLMFLPLFHCYGCFMALAGLITGCQLVLYPKFVLKELLSGIETYKIRRLETVPPVINLMAKRPEVANYNLTSLKIVMVGAAPLGKELCEEFRSRFPHVDTFKQAYGMTEMTTGCFFAYSDYTRGADASCCGALLPRMEAKIVDVDTEKELGLGQRGELWVKGPIVMKGYLNRPEATAETVTREGWLKTGDVGYFDEEERLYIVDRKKELIKVKGFQVPPAELEDILSSHPQIADAAVTSSPHDDFGEAPKAFVVCKPGQKLTEDQVKNFVKEKVAPYKQLTGGVTFLAEIPKSLSGKILRRKLKELSKEGQISSKL